MRKYIRYFLIFVIFLLPLNGNSLELCKIKNLSTDDNYGVPFCNEENSSVTDNKTNTKKSFNRVKEFVTSPYYNAKVDGLVSAVKNQQNIGACWAFSAISNVETNAKKNGMNLLDLSEAHLIYGIIGSGYSASDIAGRKGKYNTSSLNAGGISYYAASYFFNNQGQLLESEYPYPGNPVIISSADYPKGRSIVSVDTFEMLNIKDYAICTDDEITAMKQKILDNGSIIVYMYIEEQYFNDNFYDYYLAPGTASSTANHGVVIVGWDDSIPKNKFNGATRNGAWIVKNSYGSTWSRDGYFYISYDDFFVCKDYSTFSGVSNKKYDYSRSASDLVSLSGGFGTGSTIYSASKFTKDTPYDEVIKKVSVGVPNDCTYNVYISKNNFKSSPGDWDLIGSGHSDSFSIRSVYPTEEIKVTKDFTIIVETIQDSGKSGIFPTMCSYDPDFANVEYQDDTNYIGQTTTGYVDLYQFEYIDPETNEKKYIDCEPLIYVYSDSAQTDGLYVTNDTYAKVENKKIYLRIDKDQTFTPEFLDSVSEVIGKDYISNKGGGYALNYIGTGSVIHYKNGTYQPIVLRGDVTGDGTINSGDLLRLVKYFKNSVTLSTEELEAADANSDTKLDSGDLMKLVKYLKGTTSILV